MNSRINQLKDSALFYMSLGSMELFHSNFLYWLLQTNIKFVRVFFNKNEISDDILYTIKKSKIRREYKHTDISIECNTGMFIIENKIKTLPNKNQLLEYETSSNINFKKGKFLVIGDCAKPDFVLENWEPLFYNDILDKIKKILNNIKKDISENNVTIINEYISMTKNIIEVINLAVDNLKLKNTLLITKIEKSKNQLMDKLSELKLDDIIRKINGYILFENLKRELKNDYPDDEYYYQYGYNHKSITISIRKKIYFDKEKYILLGPQVEANTFRRMIHITNKSFNIDKNKGLEKIYDILKDSYFKDPKFKYPNSKNEGKKKYNQYKGIYGDTKEGFDKVEYIALYRYFKIDELIENDEVYFNEIIKIFKNELKYIKKFDVPNLSCEEK